jgi:microsomal dipeptidase-like Zn-dependent dipeptidase
VLSGITDFPNYPQQAHCNAKGLTNQGHFLMQELMDKGMIIDIDHLSRLAIDTSLELAEQRNYPLVASHITLFDDKVIKTERERTRSQLDRIRALGGMVGVGVFKGGNRDEMNEYDEDNDPSTPAPVPDDCAHSSKSFAQTYLRSVEAMGTFGVALGTDFNGIGDHPGPRFGAEGCRNSKDRLSWEFDGEPQGNPVVYPFTVPGFGTFDRQVTGDRTFDINYDGLAHVGLLPDFIADLKNVGVSDAKLEPLYNSAEAYIRMWERIDFVNSDRIAPVITLPNDLTVEATGAQTSTSIGTATATDNVGPVIITNNAPTTFPIGTTTVTWTATDGVGNVATANQVVTVVDTTAPIVTAPVAVSKEATAPQTAVDIGVATSTDLVGPVTLTSDAPATYPVGTTTVTWTATDAYNNF